MMPAPEAAGRRDEAAAPDTAGWLSLAAAPAFAAMAILTLVSGTGMAMMCGPAGGLSLLTGMAPMYVLMSAFHVAPWLKLVSRR